MIFKYRKTIIVSFITLSLISLFLIGRIKFNFSFEQFFPNGDPDLEFYNQFKKDFEPDDNFLLLAIENSPTVFDSAFLANFHQVSIELKSLPNIKSVQSPTLLDYPVKTPFGYSLIPFIHIDNPDYYDEDKKFLVTDARFVNNMIDSNATSMVIVMKTEPTEDIKISEQWIKSIHSIIEKHGFKEKAHLLGKANFQTEIVAYQKKEIVLFSLLSFVLVSIIFILIYRTIKLILIALVTISIGLLLFIGFLGLVSAELSIISALFPVILLIVSSSDVIHIMTKYLEELKIDNDQTRSLETTLKEIGIATLMTSVTTAIGFATLGTSKLLSIQIFGFQAAVGVMIAFFCALLFMSGLLTYVDRSDIFIPIGKVSFWDKILEKITKIIFTRSNKIIIISLLSIVIMTIGLVQVTTNYTLRENLPENTKLLSDFDFFEKNYAGFRPMEFAVSTKTDTVKVDDLRVVREINKIEEKIASSGLIRSSFSQATLFKSINAINYPGLATHERFPDNEIDFNEAKRLLRRMDDRNQNMLTSKDQTKTRISTRLADVGADSIKSFGYHMDKWIATNIDTQLLTVKRTGTGLILDKNSEYVTNSLLKSLGIALFIISILLGFVFRSLKMVIIALIPNIIPLMMAAAALGYFSIELEAGVSIIFTIVFGIAVDDTLHFLARYRLCQREGLDKIESIKKTINETGKAIILTTVILFFGFLIMMFSSNPPTQTAGILIALTLIGALICDLFLLPVLIIKMYK